MLKIFDINENHFVGVFVKASDSWVLVPPLVTDHQISILDEVFQVPIIITTIGNANILGCLVAINSHGAVISNIINNPEFQFLAKKMNIAVLQEKNNALGNSILVSDEKALISNDLSRQSEKKIQDVLDVETLRGTIAGQDNVGRAAVVTSNGMLCHPKITPEEKATLDDFFQMESNIGTVNFGIPLIGAGLASNSHGAIVGSRTTGVELNRIENSLDLI